MSSVLIYKNKLYGDRTMVVDGKIHDSSKIFTDGSVAVGFTGSVPTKQNVAELLTALVQAHRYGFSKEQPSVTAIVRDFINTHKLNNVKVFVVANQMVTRISSDNRGILTGSVELTENTFMAMGTRPELIHALLMNGIQPENIHKWASMSSVVIGQYLDVVDLTALEHIAEAGALPC